MTDEVDHRCCGWRWHTETGWHECRDYAIHAMEHRCNCGELYPS